MGIKIHYENRNLKNKVSLALLLKSLTSEVNVSISN